MFLDKINLLFLILLFTSGTLFSNDKKTINFAPLPTKKAEKNIAEFLPINSYMQEMLGVRINYIYKKDYQDILNGFEEGKIDIAFLGPLPFISLKKEYKFVEPIVTFKHQGGFAKYRCVLAKFKEDKFDRSKQIKVALTQPLSTCGYLMSNILLKKEFNIELKNQKYRYTMSHTNALLSVLKGESLLAGAKESIAKEYESLGIKIIAKSKLLPGFSLVANTKTLSKEQIQKLQTTLLGISDDKYKSLGGISIYGVEKSHTKDYESLDINFNIPKKGNF